MSDDSDTVAQFGVEFGSDLGDDACRLLLRKAAEEQRLSASAKPAAKFSGKTAVAPALASPDKSRSSAVLMIEAIPG
jgi:hypothetical protein